MHRVLVLGVPRSGTTWIGQALGRTRGAVYVPEPDGVTDPFAFRAQVRDGLTHYPVLRPDDRAPELARLWDGAFAGGRRAGTVRDKLARRVYQHVGESDRVKVRSGAAMTFPMRVTALTAVPRVADPSARAVVVKSVNGALAADWISEGWKPRVLVVHRDLRNVIASWLSLGFGGTIPPVYATAVREASRRWDVALREYDDPMMRSIAFCVVMTLALYDGLREHSEWCALSHEEACADSASRLAAAASALRLEWTDEAERFVRASDRPGEGYATTRVASDLPDQWKRRLTSEQVASITSVLHEFPDELWRVREHN